MASTYLPTFPFRINPRRHDVVDPAPTDPPTDPPADPPTPTDPPVDPPAAPPKPTAPKRAATASGEDSDLGERGQRALAAEREQRKAATAEAAQAKADLEAANRRIQEFEDAERSDLERAQAAADRAMERAKAADRRAVTSDIRSYAITADVVDPSDVVDALAGRADEFITDSGVDTSAIEKAVNDLIDKKPHWKKPEPVAPDPTARKPRATPAPAPDPAQGQGNGPQTPNWDDPKAFAAEMKRLRLPTYR